MTFLTNLLANLSWSRSLIFPGFSAPPVALDLKPGQRAWVPWLEPGGGGGKLSLCHYAGGQGSKARFLASDGETTRSIPTVFVRPAEPCLTLKVGTAVLAPRPGGCAYGRVSSLALETVRVNFVSGLDAESWQYPRSHVIPLGQAPHFGAPVGYREGSLWFWGQWLASARGTPWILTRKGHVQQLPESEVHPLFCDRLLPGERAVALEGEALEKARVLRMLDGGLSYLVRFESSGEVAIRDYSLVGGPL